MANLICKYKVTDTTTPTRICGRTTGFTDIIVDGVSIGTDSTGYTFSTTGFTTVEFVLADEMLIGDYDFYSCYSLTSIVIPDSVTSIGRYAFDYCSSLTEITCNAVVAPTIGSSTFNGVTTFGTLNYPEGSDYSQWLSTDRNYLGYYSWNEEAPILTCTYDITTTTAKTSLCHYATSFTTMYVDGIEQPLSTGYTFSTTGEHTVEFKMNSSTIGTSAFTDCNLTSIVISDSVTSIGKYAFYGCEFASIVIPDSVTSIGDRAFQYCDKLSSIKIGSGVTELGDYVFVACNSLTLITSYATEAPVIGENIFRDIASNGTLYYPKDSDYSSWFDGTYNLNEYNWSSHEIGYIPTETGTTLVCTYNVTDTTTKICHNHENFTYMYVDGVPHPIVKWFTFETLGEHTVVFELKDETLIYSYTFYDCPNLTGELVIPDTVTRINNDAFGATYLYSGNTLTSIVIPDSVTYIGGYAFNWSRVKKITSYAVIPPEIKSNTFQGIFPFYPPSEYYPEEPYYGTLYYPEGSDYSQWLSTDEYYLGYYNWNGVPSEPDEPDEPDEPPTPVVSPFVTDIVRVEWDGNVGDEFGTKIRVGYSNATPEEPIIGPEWIWLESVTEVQNAASYGFDKVLEYQFYFDPNETSEIRGGDVHFRAYGAYGNVYFEQDYQYIPDEPDEPDNPEGEIVTPNQTKTIPSSGTTFRYNIEANNMQGLGRYYPSDIDWITLTYIDDYNFNITVDENEGDERSETIYFVYYDNNGDAFEHELTISQDGKAVEPDEPDVPPTPPTPPTPDEPDEPVEKTPSIVVSKNQVTLDNVGDTSIIQVTYINVDEIVPPTVPDGFTIEEIERVVSEEGIQVKYKITRISPKRQNAQINFKGNTSGGKTATSKDVNLKGEPCPAEVRLWSINESNGVLVFKSTGETATVDVIVDGANAPYTFSYEIDGNGISCTSDALDWDGGDGNVNWRYNFTSIVNNGSNPYTGTITFYYKDELTNKSITLPFYVRYANEGEIHAFSYAYNFDKDGNRLDTQTDKTISVSFTKMQTINKPVVDGDWIHLNDNPTIEDYKDWVGGEYVKVGDKYTYSFTIDANSGNSRRGAITFSGVGIDGKNYEETVEFTQEGDDTVKPIDEGFIELQQLSVELMADGGAQTFQVKYYDAKTIYEPELEFDWATITEVSRTEPVPDVAWNGEECDSVIVTYRATAQPTESGRQMKVKFKADINYYDDSVVYMEKDKFIVYQLAEGSTEVQGLVSILRYSKSFTYYGSPTGWNFRVAYDNVTPDTPTISESWCRVAEVKDLKADEYDYYKEYILEMDTNNSNFSRTCTITFIGNAEEGTQIKTPFQFTQQGQEEIVNEGEYDNYKGYFMDFEGAVHSVSFITNPRSDAFGDIRLAGDSPVVVSYSENSQLYEPIRTSTCTVKVVSSHYLMNLYTGKAQGTQVILRNEDRGTIEWCGYLQPNLYNQGFTECIEEIEFEASDCLSTLQYLRYEYFYNGNGQPMIVSFKNIVDTIADRCKLINSYVFTQKLYSNSDESKIFDFKEFYISENNFYSEEGEPWTYQEVLEEICKYFGYVCFQWGDRIYFMDYDKYNSDKSMVGYRYVKEDGWLNRNYITLSNSNRITEKSIRGTGADISLDDVFNKVTVNCNYYNIENVIPDLFEDDNLTERNGISITTLANREQEIGSRTSYITYDHKNVINHFYKPEVGTSIHEREVTPTEDDFNSNRFFKSFVGANIVDIYHLDYGDVSGKSKESKEWERYLMISQLNRPWCGYEGTWHWENYNLPIMEFTQLPQIFIDNNKEVYASTSTGDRVPSTRAGGIGSSSTTSRNDRNNNVINVNKSEHYLVINAEAAFSPNFDVPFIDENADPKGFEKTSNNYYEGFYFDKIKTNDDASTKEEKQQVTPALTFYLEIPQAGWWDGTKWVDYETWFEVPLEPLNYLNDLWYSSKNVENQVNTNLFLGTTGYKIQLPEKMESTAFMQFKIGMPKRFAHVADSWGGDFTATAGNAYCFIKNLEMNIVSRNSALMKDDDIIFENVIDDNNVVDGPEIELKITSDNNITYSFSTVSTKYGEEEINTTNFRFYDLEGELVLPEEAIINHFVKQYSTPTLKENITVDMSFTPTQMIQETYWGESKNFVITAQELDYKMCRQQITLLEKK